MGEIFKIIVGRMGVEINYFKYRMKNVEIRLLLDAHNDEYREKCELSRMTGISAIYAFGGKPYVFPWEKKQEESKPVDKDYVQKLIAERKKLI